MSYEAARDKAAKLLKKRTSVASQSQNSSEVNNLKQYREHRRPGSVSTYSYMDDPSQDTNCARPAARVENTYRMGPDKKFPKTAVATIIEEVLHSYLAEEKYDIELCRQMSKTISEVVKARVKELQINRYKIICLVHIGSLNDHGLRISSRFLWDQANDTFSTYEFRNNSLFAVGTVYAIFSE